MTNLKTKKQPELPENKIVWKSNNQGVKEETFFQTGRRVGDWKLGWRGRAARWQLEDHMGKTASGGWDSPTFVCR